VFSRYALPPHRQCGIRGVRVDLGRRDTPVVEEALEVADVDAFLDEVGGDGAKLSGSDLRF